MEKGVTLVIAVLLCTASISSAQEEADTLMGKALYYKKPYTPSYCFGELDLGMLVASVSNDLWENGKACGQIYGVRCQRASSDDLEPACREQPQENEGVYVSIVDNCKKCDNGTILLSEEAFEYIARKEAGSIQVVYKNFS